MKTATTLKAAAHYIQLRVIDYMFMSQDTSISLGEGIKL